MKTTLEISDPLLKAAKAAARAEGTTLRAVVERGLRATLKQPPSPRRFRLRDASVKGRGLQPAASQLQGSQLIDLGYDGRGS